MSSPAKDLVYFHFILFIDECEEVQFVIFTLIYCIQTGLGVCALEELQAFFTGQMQFHLKDSAESALLKTQMIMINMINMCVGAATN